MTTFTRWSRCLALLVWFGALAPCLGADTDQKVQVLLTPSGVRFGLLGSKSSAPAPTLFVFATSLEEALTRAEFNKAGHLAAKQGYLCVALDLPCHGQDVQAQEPTGLSGWRARLEKGDQLVPGFVAQASAVLDHLIKEGYTDPRQVAAIGTSRGGFIALHFAAADGRVRSVAAFAPVTNLLALREFAGMDKHALTQALALSQSADKLAGRHVWICIGNQDERVNTDDTIAFTRKLVAAAVAQKKPAPVELHVMPTLGHQIHGTAHEEVAAWLVATLEKGSDAIPIGNRACLFLDDRFLAEQTGLRRTWHRGRPLPEPAIVPTKPWERWPHLFGSVVYDPQDQLYKMWYESLNGYRGNPESLVLYAQSQDGKVWSKPDLGIHELRGSKANNIVLPNAELPNVFLDPKDADPKGRWKMFAWVHKAGYRVYRSGDGIHWELLGQGIPASLIDPAERITISDTNQVIWDGLAGRYLSTYRTYPQHGVGFRKGHRRGIGVTTSDRLLSGWQPIVTVLRADAQDDERVGRLSRGPQPDWAELYVMPVFPYGNHYLGLLSLLDYVDGNDRAVGGGDLQLAFSHDGLKWHRPVERQSLIARNPTADLFPVYAACSAPLEIGKEIWIYYSEANGAHPTPDPKSLIRAAAWRKDGFVSIASQEERPGVLTTPPLLFEGQRLELNLQTDKGGQVRVAVLDGRGTPLKGFEEAACDLVQGDALAQVVSWQGKTDLSSLRGQPVRLRLTLSRSRLYSFRFAP